MGAAHGLQARDLVRLRQKYWSPASFLAQVGEQAIDDLVSGRQAVSFAAGETFIVEEQPGDSVFLLVDALVKVTVRQARQRSRKEQPGKDHMLLAVRVSGDIVGEMAVADGGPRSATVTAVRGDDVAVAVPGDEFMEVVGRYPVAAKLLAAQLSSKLRASDRRRSDMYAHSMRQRVARMLIELADDHGRPGRPGLTRQTTVALRVGVTQQEFASLVGGGESTVHKELKALKAQGIVAWQYRAAEIQDIGQLRRVADGVAPG